MPTSYTDQFYIIDPSAPPPSNTPLTVLNYSVTDTNDDGFIGTGVGDTVDGQVVTSVWVGDTVTVRLAGGGPPVTITGVTFYLADGRSIFTPTDGTILQDATFRNSSFVSTSTQVPVSSLGPPCFTRGTLIATPGGDVPVEDLKAGDLVTTMDNGPQALLLVEHKVFPATGCNAPVRIRKGALGNDTDLLVSQQHRMLVGGWRAELFFGVPQVLVAAKHLCNGDSIVICPGKQVEYYHILFARHEIVWAAGIPSESYFPGYATHQADQDTRSEIDRLFPDLARMAKDKWLTARPIAKRFEAGLLH